MALRSTLQIKATRTCICAMPHARRASSLACVPVSLPPNYLRFAGAPRRGPEARAAHHQRDFTARCTWVAALVWRSFGHGPICCTHATVQGVCAAAGALRVGVGVGGTSPVCHACTAVSGRTVSVRDVKGLLAACLVCVCMCVCMCVCVVVCARVCCEGNVSCLLLGCCLVCTCTCSCVCVYKCCAGTAE